MADTIGTWLIIVNTCYMEEIEKTRKVKCVMLDGSHVIGHVVDYQKSSLLKVQWLRLLDKFENNVDINIDHTMYIIHYKVEHE